MLRAALFACATFAAIMAIAAIFHPDSALPDAWNPVKPLKVIDPVTPLTSWKFARAKQSSQVCRAVLASVSENGAPALRVSDNANCQVQNPVSVNRVGGASTGNLDTDCATALSLAMWEHHGLQPAAIAHFGVQVSRIDHLGSYSCRRIRTTRGDSQRWSTHATASAIDVSGFRLSDGQDISLVEDWDAAEARGRFLRAAQESACKWFATALGPDYNALHADHFHLQSTGWGTCR